MRELTALYLAQCNFSDMHKDVYGVRPRWASVEQMNDLEWLNGQVDSLCEEMKYVREREQKGEEKAISIFEALVNDVIAMGAKTREVAIKWLFDAEDVGDDSDYFCYRNGLPYGYFK